jgi:pyridoxal phosphate enzyme (YggS family)
MAESRSVPENLDERFANIQGRIKQTLDRCGRHSSDVTLVAISKTHPASVVANVIQIGATDVGENRVQEAESKILEIGRDKARWHLVGHLQANKARRAVKLFDVIHSLDSIELAQRLDRLCEEEAVDELSVLIQVDLAREATKSGAAESDLNDLAAEINRRSHLRLLGLMTLPPFFDDPEEARPFFRRLATLRDDLRAQGMFHETRGELSMGMTHDFEIAIEEGATMVRIGTAIFGERPAQVEYMRKTILG